MDQRFEKRLLVGGGSGFVGRHLIEEMLAERFRVRCLDLCHPVFEHEPIETVEGSFTKANPEPLVPGPRARWAACEIGAQPTGIMRNRRFDQYENHTQRCPLDGEAVQIWGEGFLLHDYVYINDVLAARFSVLRSEQANGVINVGTGRGHSLFEGLDCGERACRRVKKTVLPWCSFDVRAVYSDITPAYTLLGWSQALS